MPRLVLAYKNFAANQNISHIGLGVSALNTSKVLRRSGIITDVWPVVNAKQLHERLQSDPATHAVIMAPWIPSVEIHGLVSAHANTRFAVNCHSNVGFLRADSNGVKLVGEAIDVEACSHNFHLAGNSQKFCKWIRSAYSRPCTHLPNLYYLDADYLPWRPLYSGGTLRIGFRRHSSSQEFYERSRRGLGEFTDLQNQPRAMDLRRANRWGWRHNSTLRAGHVGRAPARASGRERMAVLAPVPPERCAHASVVAAQLHRVVQHDNGRRRGGGRTVGGLSRHRLDDRSMEGHDG